MGLHSFKSKEPTTFVKEFRFYIKLANEQSFLK